MNSKISIVVVFGVLLAFSVGAFKLESGDFVVTGDGRVGIGTSSPSAELEVSADDSQIRVTSGSNSGVVQVTSKGKMAFGSWSSGGNLFVDLLNGFVGIGTSSPGAPFEIFASDGHIKLSGSGGVGVVQTYNNLLSLGAWSSGGSLKIDLTSGNVGIGAVPSSNKLNVAGSVSAQSYNLCVCIQCKQNNGPTGPERCGSLGEWSDYSIPSSASGSIGCRTKIQVC